MLSSGRDAFWALPQYCCVCLTEHLGVWDAHMGSIFQNRGQNIVYPSSGIRPKGHRPRASGSSPIGISTNYLVEGLDRNRALPFGLPPDVISRPPMTGKRKFAQEISSPRSPVSSYKS